MSSGQSQLVREQYETFDTEAYLKYFGEVFEVEKFFLRGIHEAFKSGRVKGDRVLDFGCGPVPHRMSAPSRSCRSITYSDFSEANLNSLQAWLKSETSGPEYRHLFKFLAELEEFQDVEAGVLSIEKRIKEKVIGVVKCDVFDEHPLGKVDQLFDVIYTGACLESASPDLESYVLAMKNLTSLLNVGGYLILTGFTEGNFYIVGDVKFPCLKYDSKFTRKTLEDIGFDILELTDLIPEKHNVQEDLSDCQGCLCVVARKK